MSACGMHCGNISGPEHCAMIGVLRFHYSVHVSNEESVSQRSVKFWVNSPFLSVAALSRKRAATVQ